MKSSGRTYNLEPKRTVRSISRNAILASRLIAPFFFFFCYRVVLIEL
jgi:hypothetical protein